MRRSFAEGLYDFFTQFGPVKEAVIMMDKNTGKPRGFGFVAFRTQHSAFYPQLYLTYMGNYGRCSTFES